MSTPKEIVEKAVAENTVVVFSKTWCPYSKAAKALLKEKYSDAQTVIIELDERADGGDLQNYLLEKTGQRTVPNVFIKQQHIGGSSDLQTLDEKDGIRVLLN